MFTRQLLVSFLSIILVSSVALSEEKEKSDLLDKSLEELMNLEVSTVGKKEQSWFKVPSAIAVITPEDIERSGHTSLPELLRLAPGYSVGQIDSNKWAVSARGGRDLYAHNLLVLQDGRSIYTPFFGGVYWNSQDTMFDNIERIETVRGPGGSLWGSNASTGIVNIITKHAKDTQGWHFSGTRGSEERNSGEVRYGGQFAPEGFYRVNVKYFDRDETTFLYTDNNSGSNNNDDDWEMFRGEARADWKFNEQDSLMLEAANYAGDGKQLFDDVVSMALTGTDDTRLADIDMNGSHILGRWNRKLSETDNIKVQAYYDWYRYDEDTNFGESRWTGDIDFQHQFQWTPSQNIIWGLAYRYTEDDPIQHLPGTILEHNPDGRGEQTYSAFVQDEIALIANKLLLTIGSKFEHNDYTGVEAQPSARLAWLMSPYQTLWGSVGRAVRVPSRFTHDASTHLFTLFGLTGGSVPSADTQSEQLMAYEMGYRFNFMDKAYLDAAVFYNVFSELLSPMAATGRFSFSNIAQDNNTDAESYGLELLGTWQVNPNWKLTANYSLLRIFAHAHSSVSSQSAAERYHESLDPEHQFQVRSYWDVTDDFSFDTAVYYVDHTPPIIDNNTFTNTNNIQIPSYVRLDMRFAWKVAKDLTLTLVGQNLLDDRHVEYVRPEYQKAEIERAAYLKLDYKM